MNVSDEELHLEREKNQQASTSSGNASCLLFRIGDDRNNAPTSKTWKYYPSIVHELDGCNDQGLATSSSNKRQPTIGSNILQLRNLLCPLQSNQATTYKNSLIDFTFIWEAYLPPLFRKHLF